MGLDLVELMLAVEQEFDIAIPTSTASTLVSVGALHEGVLDQLRQRGESPDETLVWEKLRHLIVQQLGVRPDEVIRSAEFVRDLKCD